MWHAWVAAAALLVAASPSAGQVMVAPTSVFLTDADPFGVMVVTNTSPDSQEVTVGVRFGFPVSDPTGELQMEWSDAPAEASSSLDDRLHVFPRRFILAPGGHQTVRLAASGEGSLPAGAYWTRLITTSRTVQVSSGAEEGAGVVAWVRYDVEQVTTAILQVGAVASGVIVGDVDVAADAEAVVLRVPLERVGNSPYFGTAIVTVRDQAGEVVAEQHALVSVYFDLVRRIELDRTGLAPGVYTADLRLVSTRSDVPVANRIPSPVVLTRVAVRLP